MPTIEQNLERIADALEKIAANGGGGFIANVVNTTAASEPDTSAADKAAADKAAADKAAADKKAADAKAAAAKKAAEEKAAADAKAAEEAAAAAALGGDAGDKPKHSKDDVRKALQAYREIEGTPAMLEILKKAGATTLNDLAEDKYDEVVAAVS
ncbi:hypothetical protein RCRUDOLPH_66 [Rhodobacter phage RcRudolph]|nr:hypothetical protein RCRUDOLPH_66 [Rhodobacter phage RcRudolph]